MHGGKSQQVSLSPGQAVTCRERTTWAMFYLSSPHSHPVLISLSLFFIPSLLIRLPPHGFSAFSSHSNRGPPSCIYTQQALYGEGRLLYVKTMLVCQRCDPEQHNRLGMIQPHYTNADYGAELLNPIFRTIMTSIQRL